MALTQLPRLLTACVLSATLALTACGSNQEATNEVDLDQTIGLEVEAARVTLLDAGTAPYTTLRYNDAGTEQTSTVTVGEDFQQVVAENEAAIPQLSTASIADADFRADLIAQTEEVSDSETGSDRSINIQMENMEYLDSQTSADATHLESAAGFSFGWYANDRGVISSVNFSAPVDATDEGRSLVEDYILKILSLPVIFPEEEVGVGGSWTVETRVTGEENLLQTITYTVAALAEDAVDLSVEVHQRPSLGALNYEDTSLEVLDAQSITTDDALLTVNLSNPLPTAGSVAFNSQVVYGESETEVAVVQQSTTSLDFS